jgi:hypothetical protein
MPAHRLGLFALVFVAGFAVCHLTRSPARATPSAIWPAEVPQRVVVSYPEKDGRVGHVLCVNRVSTSISETTLDSSAWRINLTTQNGVWFLECDQVGSDFVR